MTKIHREFFDNGNIKKEIYYDADTTLVTEWRRYDGNGTLILKMRGEGEVTLEQMLQTIPLISSDASYIDEEALQQEQSREAVERAQAARIALEERIAERRRAEQEAEARLKAAERFIGRTLGDNDLA